MASQSSIMDYEGMFSIQSIDHNTILNLMIRCFCNQWILLNLISHIRYDIQVLLNTT
jgi:hypothetical protein